jgi:hypothetical protein
MVFFWSMARLKALVLLSILARFHIPGVFSRVARLVPLVVFMALASE